MKVLNLLHVIAGMDPKSGGVCQAVLTIINALAPSGIINEVVSLDKKDAPYLNYPDFKLHALGEGMGPWKFNVELKDWLQINLIRFDIVIVHGLWLYPGFAVRRAINFLFNRGAQVPKVLVMPHGMLDPYFQLASKRKLKAIRNFFFWKLIENKLIASADAILFTCKMEMKLAAASFRPYKPKLQFLVGMGVQKPPEFSNSMNDAFRQQSGFNNQLPYILFLGRMEEKKGVDLLIKAYLNLKQSIKKLPALVIAGPGLVSLYGRQLKQAANNDPAIIFVNMLVGEAKWGAFYGCEAFVLSSYQENFGIAVVEAMACGKPVLITDQINIYKEIEDCNAGLVCAVNETSIESMLLKWNNLSDDKRIQMAGAASLCFNNLFSLQTFSKRLSHQFSTI